MKDLTGGERHTLNIAKHFKELGGYMGIFKKTEKETIYDDYDDEYDAPTGNTRNLGRSAKKSKKGRKSDDYDVDFIDL